jgi:hypothetical protein
MIPNIEKIIEDLLAGHINKTSAIGWLYQHVEDAYVRVEDAGLRDHFAGLAAQGLCADRHHSDTQGSPRNIAIIAYEVADAMMKARDVRD